MMLIKIPLMMLTDCEILFNFLTRLKVPTEKRLILDLLAVRQLYDRKEINKIALIESESKPEVGLPKLNSNGSEQFLMATGKLQYHIRQYVIDPLTPRCYSQNLKGTRVRFAPRASDTKIITTASNWSSEDLRINQDQSMYLCIR